MNSNSATNTIFGKTGDYERYFLNPGLEQELRRCPCCGAMAAITSGIDKTIITCRKDGHRTVSATTLHDAIKLWQEPRFTDHA